MPMSKTDEGEQSGDLLSADTIEELAVWTSYLLYIVARAKNQEYLCLFYQKPQVLVCVIPSHPDREGRGLLVTP